MKNRVEEEMAVLREEEAFYLERVRATEDTPTTSALWAQSLDWNRVKQREASSRMSAEAEAKTAHHPHIPISER